MPAPDNSAPAVQLGQGEYVRTWPARWRRAPIIPAGTAIAEPFEVYRQQADSHLTSHWLAEFRRCPLTYRKKRLGLIPEAQSEAYAFGRAVHTFVLEGGDVFHREFAVGGPANPKTGRPYGRDTKAFAEWAAEQGKPCVSTDDLAVIEEMAHNVQQHQFAAQLLSTGQPEAVVRSVYCDWPCQGRIDWLNLLADRGIVDLKTCRSLDDFEADIHRYGYIHQLAFYRELVFATCGIEVSAHIIGVEKEMPYRVGVWHVPDHMLDEAARDNAAAIRDLNVATENDVWLSRYETLREVPTTKEIRK